ncbi:MAG: tetratricopeptide repeat protein [Myxococcales bacterium]|nr:tetratricopeptide repeat protein [Myxococcales bacterium]
MLAPLVLCLILLASPPVRAATSCTAECQELARQGLLEEGLGIDECKRTVCVEDARVHYQAGRYEQALASLDHIRELAAEYEAYQFERGLVLYALDRHEDALASFTLVTDAHPESMRAGAQRAHLLVRLERPDEALAQFRALHEVPQAEVEHAGIRSKSYLLGNIGIIELRQGKLEAGRKHLDEALAIDGRNRVAGTYLYRVVPALESGALGPDGIALLLSGSEHRSLGLAGDAARDFEQLVEAWPRFGLGWRMLSELQVARAAYAECESLLRRAEGFLPDNIEIRVQRIRCQLLWAGPEAEDSSAAIAELEQVALEHPENVRAQDLLMALDRPLPVRGRAPAKSPEPAESP